MGEATAEQGGRSWHSRLADLRFANPLYRLSLIGPTPGRLSRLPPEPWPGDPEAGAATLAGKLNCAGQVIDAIRPDWRSAALSTAALAELNGFGWLDDLAAAGGAAAKERAHALIADWIARDDGWHHIAWAPEVTGRRLAAWLAHAKFYSRGEGDEIGPALLASTARQARHLARVAGRSVDGVERLIALRGLVYTALCGFGGGRRIEGALRLFEREIARQVLPDGGHVERSPAAHLTALAALVDIRDMLVLAGRWVPDDLVSAIDRMAPVLRFFRHGDGGLALFNDSNEADAAMIDTVLARSGAKGRPPETAPHSGFQRLAADRVLVLVDAGPPPPAGLDRRTHAGVLAFEMSFGKERLVVNCGAHPSPHPAWRRAQRFTAAHSTLAIDDTNSAEILDSGGLGRRPTTVECMREEADGNIWIAGSHDGYLANFGVVHRRRLYLSHDGEDLRGEDTLVPQPGSAPPAAHAFTARFHLHPDVQASSIQNGAAVLLRLPSGTAWRFQTSGGALDIAESVYLGRRGAVRRCEQIVATGALAAEGAALKWAFKRLPKA
ncbi:MAG: heparinase II/III family protein [Rhodospirillales bacterium]|nr:heparinase II/III family protein [Rhodospirillales bacterium]